MGTSMLIERFHKRIKHEISDAKGNIRIDAFIEILITLFPFMEEMEYKGLLSEMLENFLVVAEVVVNSTEYPAPICPEESNRDSSTDLEPSSSITEIMDKNEELLVESELSSIDSSTTKDQRLQIAVTCRQPAASPIPLLLEF